MRARTLERRDVFDDSRLRSRRLCGLCAQLLLDAAPWRAVLVPEPLAHRELQPDALVRRLERGERGDCLVLLLDNLRDALLADPNRIVDLTVHLEQLVLGYLDLPRVVVASGRKRVAAAEE